MGWQWLGRGARVNWVRGALHRGTGAIFLSLLVACGGSPPPPVESSAAAKEQEPATDPLASSAKSLALASPASHGAPPEARSAHASPSPAPARDASRSVGVRGITGSLSAYEVEQAMNERQTELLACVQQRPRGLGFVAGNIAFHMEVDGKGRVDRVLVTESDIGYPVLEACLSSVVATAPLKAPAGGQAAEAQWRMGVDPLGRAAEFIDSAELESTIERHAADTYESCEIAKNKRFLVNGYVGRKHTLDPASVVPAQRKLEAQDEETRTQIACLTQALAQWKGWPKVRGAAKVGFELRWVPEPPPPARKGKKAKRRR
ncbi:MAG: hypothetical protein QM778_17300 [Myxococcales bacterium]